MRKFADIIIDNRASETDRPYTYIIRDTQIDILEIGMRVVIPFGRGNRKIKGLVIDIKDTYDGKYKLKEIEDIIDEKPIINKDLLEISLWMSDYYISPYLDSINTVLPPGDFKKLQTELYLKKEDIKEEVLKDIEIEIIKLIKNDVNNLETIKEKIKNRDINKIVRDLEERNILKSKLLIETSVKKVYESYVRINKDIENPKEELRKNAYKQLEIIDFLLKNDKEVKLSDLLKATDSSSASVKSLEEKNLVKIEKKEIYREAVKKEIPYYEKHILTKEQEIGLEKILTSTYNDFLLHGITGSGKTEVYLQVVEEMLKQKKDTIILVPEISLTPQTIDRFVGRFGERVAVLHSRLSFGERFDQWRKIRDGDVSIVVGARSAVFAPFNNLGAIIIDEEHESSYKSSMNPKYTAAEVAKKRIEKSNGILIRGSATPSMETYYQAINGDIELIELKERTNKKPLPELEITDMREELQNGNRTMFSRKLYQALKDNLENKRQSILFLNRRGYSTFVSCRECGYVVKCSECDISLTYHRKQNICKCHYCGLTEKTPDICPECGSKYIRYFGTGTEQVEEFTRSLFPEAVIDRMDLDTVTKKDSYDKKLDNMKNKKTDILIGTQMIAKGLDFSNVTLVGVITADTSLNLPDFRASEKTFQLITQVAGRSGRGELDGRVIVQTYTPEHFSIVHSKTHDYISFYNEEIKFREAFAYPPFKEIFSILIYGENLNEVRQGALSIKNRIEDYIFKYGLEVEIVGPYPAPLDKIKRNFRYQILFKVKEDGKEKLKDIINRVYVTSREDINLNKVKFSIDVSPISIL